MALRSTCSERNQPGTRVRSTYSGRPELKPMNTQISMRRVNRTSRKGGAASPRVVAGAGAADAPLSVFMAAASVEAVYRERPEQIGQDGDRPSVIHYDPLQDSDGMRSAEGLEIADRKQVHVGCVVPFERQCRGYRHAPAHDLQPVSPITEVREGDYGLAPHTQHLTDDLLGVPHGLQRLGQDYVV